MMRSTQALLSMRQRAHMYDPWRAKIMWSAVCPNSRGTFRGNLVEQAFRLHVDTRKVKPKGARYNLRIDMLTPEGWVSWAEEEGVGGVTFATKEARNFIRKETEKWLTQVEPYCGRVDSSVVLVKEGKATGVESG